MRRLQAIGLFFALASNFLLGAGSQSALAQQPFVGPGVVPGGGAQGLGVGPQGGNPNNPQGGGANADFESLIDLIVGTVQPPTWTDAGGAADIRPFPNGVWVDAKGVLQQAAEQPATTTRSVVPPPRPIANGAEHDPRQTVALRVVSLTRLERELARRRSAHEPLDESMLTLAGLERVQYVFVYPESGEVALAGPAGDWKLSEDGRLVSTTTGAAVVRLDDLLELWRRERGTPGKPFGCSITPRQAGLAATQTYIAKHQDKPVPARGREKYVEGLRESLGRQDIEVFGIGADTHAALVLVEADYHMKRIGIGLEPGVAGVDSYLTSLARQGSTPASSVLRWWFATNYQGIARNESQTAFELIGKSARVLSENELLTERGERVHTGQSDVPTQEFAHQFTEHIDGLASKYPVYGELRNLFDLSIVAALLETNDLPALAGWQPSFLVSAGDLPVPKYRAPREVDTIANHHSTDRNKFVAVVSGGVWIDAAGVLQKSQSQPVVAQRNLDYQRHEAPTELANNQWWWDAEE